MDNKELEKRILAIAARGEDIKCRSAEHLWICRNIKPLLPLPDKPLAHAATSLGDPAVNLVQVQPQPQLRPRLLNSGQSASITWASIPERKNPAK